MAALVLLASDAQRALLAPAAGLAADAPSVCLLTPSVAGTKAVVPLPRPTIFSTDPLAEVRLLRRGRLLWQRGPTGGAGIREPMAWPLPPIRGGEELTLLLRPLGAAPDAFAVVRLVGAAAPLLRRNERLLLHLAQASSLWEQAVERALRQGDESLAMALLFAVEGPSSPELDGLRLEVYRQACSGP